MKEKLEILRQKFHNTKSEAEIQNIKNEMKKLLDEKPNDFANSMLDIATKIADDTDEILLKDKLKDVAKIISISYIAKEYFGKSRAWLHQRINGYLINGKPATFTDEEKNTLNFALQDITKIIGSVSI